MTEKEWLHQIFNNMQKEDLKMFRKNNNIKNIKPNYLKKKLRNKYNENLFLNDIKIINSNFFKKYNKYINLNKSNFNKALSDYIKHLKELINKSNGGNGGASNSYYTQNHPNNNNHPRPSDDGPDL